MADFRKIGPLQWNVPIVGKDGRPTPEFMRRLQLMLGAGDTTQTDVSGLADKKADKTTKVIAGAKLTGGGDLTGDVTLNHEASTVAAGTYGDATHVPAITVDELGHVTEAVSVPITGGGGGGGGLYDISKGVPNPATTYGLLASNFAWSQNGAKGLNIKYTLATGLTRSIPGFKFPKPATTSWHVCALVLFTGGAVLYYGAHIGMQNSATGRASIAVAFSPSNQTFELQTWTSDSVRNAVVTSTWANHKYEGPIWLHLKSDGTTLSFGFSRDGANPVWGLTQALSAWVTSAADYVLVGLFAEPNTSVLGTNVSILCYDDDADSRVVGA